MVSNKFLGALCVKLELHTHLRYFGGVLQSQITHYAEEIQTAAGQSEGAMDYWTTTRDPPKVGSSTKLLGGDIKLLIYANSACQIWWKRIWEPFLLTQTSTSKR